MFAPAFPYVKTLNKGQLSIVVQNYNETHFERAHQLFVQAYKNGEGYGKEEVAKEYLLKRFKEVRTIIFTEEASGKVIMALPIMDTLTGRSTQTYQAALYSVVHQDFRGQGVVKEAYKLGFQASMDIGYLGVLARSNITTKNLIPSLAVGAQITGTIPMCSYFDKVGYADDLLLYKNHNLHKNAPEYYAVSIFEMQFLHLLFNT